MAGLLSKLIPTAILGALAPVAIIVLISLLISRRGLAKALAFGLASIGTLAIVGAIALATASTNAGSSEKEITGTVLVVLGIAFLVIAARQLLHAPELEAPPRVMVKLDEMSPVAAAVFGVIAEGINVKQIAIYLGGVKLIVNADVTAVEGWLALVILLAIIQLGLIIPVAAYLLAPDPATRVLQRFRGWLVANNRVISIVLGLVVGAAFLVVGISEITG